MLTKESHIKFHEYARIPLKTDTLSEPFIQLFASIRDILPFYIIASSSLLKVITSRQSS